MGLRVADRVRVQAGRRHDPDRLRRPHLLLPCRRRGHDDTADNDIGWREHRNIGNRQARFDTRARGPAAFPVERSERPHGDARRRGSHGSESSVSSQEDSDDSPAWESFAARRRSVRAGCAARLGECSGSRPRVAVARPQVHKLRPDARRRENRMRHRRPAARLRPSERVACISRSRACPRRTGAPHRHALLQLRWTRWRGRRLPPVRRARARSGMRSTSASTSSASTRAASDRARPRSTAR